MGIIKSFDIRRLKPFHRPDESLPTPAPEKQDAIAELDPDLKPEEQAYVGHYLRYADVLLKEPPESLENEAAERKPSSNKVVKMRAKRESKESAQRNGSDQNGNDKAA